MIASLPMYAFPHTAAAEDQLWAAIRTPLRAQGIDAPDALIRDPGDLIAHWTDPALILSQTCGRPYKLHLYGKAQLVGTPDYGLDGCPPGYYQSLVIARDDDPRGDLDAFHGARFAMNGPESQSGWAALAAEAPDILQGDRIVTSSHHASLIAVREGRADFAAIDAVTFRHLTAASETSGVKIIHRTTPRPGLPLITNIAQDADPIFNAVTQAITALDPKDRACLGLVGLVRIPAADYLALPVP